MVGLDDCYGSVERIELFFVVVSWRRRGTKPFLCGDIRFLIKVVNLFIRAGNSTAVAAVEGRYIQGDPLNGYYDFVISEGSYKFWAVFQVMYAFNFFTAGLIRLLDPIIRYSFSCAPP